MNNNIDRFYIGESTRPVRLRFNEHLSNARLRKSETPFGEHVKLFHDQLEENIINKSFSIEILSTNRDCADLKIDESIKIRNLNPPMNTMTSSWPLVPLH